MLARLRHHVTLNPRAETGALSEHDEVDFMPMEALLENGTIEIKERRSLAEVTSSYSGFSHGDVLYAKVTPCFENGKAAPVLGLSRGIGFGTTEVTVLRPRPTLDQKFLYYLISDDRFRSGAIASMTGAGGLRRVPDSYARDFTFELPPIEEQRRIAEFLDRETAQIDELIAKQEQLIFTLAEHRDSVILNGVTRGFAESEGMQDSGVDWLGCVPRHWEIRRIKDSVRASKNGVWGDDPDGGADDVWIIRVADFDRARRIVTKHKQTYRKVRQSDRAGRLLRPGDLVLEKSGGGEKSPVGFVALYDDAEPALTSNFVARLELASNCHSRYWLYVHGALYSSRITERSIKQTSGIQNLDQPSYFNERVPFPPLEEQQRIACEIDERLRAIDVVADRVEQFVERLRERRQALISAAVTGQIDVGGAS